MGGLTSAVGRENALNPGSNDMGIVAANPSADRQPAHEWRVVCDSMLGGLARQLRMCGCDCVYVEFDRRGDQSAKIAVRQKRVFLTRGGAYDRVGTVLPNRHRYRAHRVIPIQRTR